MASFLSADSEGNVSFTAGHDLWLVAPSSIKASNDGGSSYMAFSLSSCPCLTFKNSSLDLPT